MLISKSDCLSHTTSLIVDDMALYSPSSEDREIVFCFVDFHEIKLSHKKTQNLVIDFLVRMHEPQS